MNDHPMSDNERAFYDFLDSVSFVVLPVFVLFALIALTIAGPTQVVERTAVFLIGEEVLEDRDEDDDRP